MSLSRPRQNYHSDAESGVNKQINLELYASYVYQSMAYYFDRDDVALRGFYKFFKKSSEEEREHAEKLMKFQNQRGGRIVLSDIKRPDNDEWGTGLQAMEVALNLEKNVNQSLLDLHKTAENHGDSQSDKLFVPTTQLRCVTGSRATSSQSKWKPSKSCRTTSPT